MCGSHDNTILLKNQMFKLFKSVIFSLNMSFLSEIPDVHFNRPLFCGVLANTMLSTVPGVSGAGPSPDKTLLTPILDAELISHGIITSSPVKPNTPTGCPTPATITRAMMSLLEMRPLFVNAGLRHRPTVPCLDMNGEAGGDPRTGDAVPDAAILFQNGEETGKFLSGLCDLLVIGESVPGGTTTALCVLLALGYQAQVSSSFVDNPVSLKEAIAREAVSRIRNDKISDPLDVIRYTGDPMMPVVAGIAKTFTGELFLAGGTQMLAVAAVMRGLGISLPSVVTTKYVGDDSSANVQGLALQIGAKIYFVDPGFGDLGHRGLARYCIGEVKEGMGAGGAMLLAHLCGHSPEKIRNAILSTVNGYA